MVGKDEAKRQSFYVVYVPEDENKDLEEWAIKLPADKEEQLGCLTERLREHFKGGSTTVFKQQQEETFKQQLLAQLPKGAALTDEMMKMMLQMDSLVDSIPLVLNTSDVKHMMEVKGDAFIGRVFDNDDDFVRMDFRLSEVSGSAQWMQVAKLQSNAAVARNGGEAAGGMLTRAKAPSKMMLPGSIQRICGADRCSKNGLLRCSRCKAQFYCSMECQKIDWKLHKVGCSK
ncbi:unnamed protein product [Peronospora belbahrii]|uniref:MYND-type domain-containing protein n=1 Tax=Peronospora belbahrii TaxID=622444 RepID=A0AAU9LEZ1_9STRA|nr:unnamed protein product [Peronospora belbahrii]